MSDANEFLASESPMRDQTVDEAESLIWALLDDQLDETDTAKLCQLMEGSAAVRSRYIDCVQLHVDLSEHFSAKAMDQPPGVQVLPNLLPGLTPGVESIPRVPE